MKSTCLTSLHGAGNSWGRALIGVWALIQLNSVPGFPQQ